MLCIGVAYYKRGGKMGDEELGPIIRHTNRATQAAPIDSVQAEQLALRKKQIIAELTKDVAQNSLAEVVLSYEQQTLEVLERILKDRNEIFHYGDEESQ